MEEIIVDYLGLKPYNEVLELQQETFNRLVEEKMQNGRSSSPMRLILCQHEPVYTLGKNGNRSNLLPSAEKRGAEFIHTNRGGDITFHGPGQLVGYPILDLERLNIGLAKYIEQLEEVIIGLVANYGLKGERVDSASGVWLDGSNPGKIRKICALGIRSSRWVTMHGFAFNVKTDLSWFDYINPCGFSDRAVTSLEKELKKEVDLQKIVNEYSRLFLREFNLNEAPKIINV